MERSSKNNKVEKKFLKICPYCGSLDYTQTLAGQIGITGLLDRCGSCGEVSTFPLIRRSLINSFRKKLKENGN